MNNSLIFGILAVILAQFWLSLCLKSDTSSEGNCDKNTVKRIDDLVSRLTTYGNSGRKFPETPEEIPKYCKYWTKDSIL